MCDQGELRSLYPEEKAFDKGFLKVTPIHTLAYWQYGNPNGNPVVFLHGGPGGGSSPRDSRYFRPDRYRVILFDQRGSGQSTPSAETRDNTSWTSVADMERLREHLGVHRWVVFGGSWGATLALAYAQTHPQRVKALVLRGIFTIRRKELDWFYEDRGGACMVYPDYFDGYRDYIPKTEQDNLMGAYYRRLTSDDSAVREEAAVRFASWELATSRLHVDAAWLAKARDVEWAVQHGTLECHYFINGGFMDFDDQLLQNIGKIRHIPATIVQGRYDIVCPMDTAWAIHKAWPEAEFHVVPDAGHSALEPGVTSRLVKAADKYSHL